MKGSSSRIVGIGVIGCGKRIRTVLEGIPGINKRFHVEAICDPQPNALKAMRKKLSPAARIFQDYRRLVTDPKVDWVYVGSWNCFHREHAIAAMEAGKHVFCEKPLATTLADCLAMKTVHERTRKMFFVGFTLRFSPHYRKIYKLVTDGAIGKIISMEFNETLHFNHGGFIHGDWRRLRSNAGTHLLEKCCHDMDLAHWMVGSVPIKAASFGGRNFFVPKNKHLIVRTGPRPDGYRSFGWGAIKSRNPFTTDHDIVDNQVAALEFANGVRASFHTNCSTNLPERRMYLCGTRGTLRSDLMTGRIEVCRNGYGEKPKVIRSGANGWHGGGDAVLSRDLANTMIRGATPKSTLQEGLKAAIVCFGIDQAMDHGRVVDFRPMWRRAEIPAVSDGSDS